MSDFKNLTDEDVQRIERGIVYSFPARDGTGLIVCVGTYGDLSNQVRVKGNMPMGEFLPMATDRISYWFCHRINGILEGEEISEYASWKIVDGMPVAPPYITPLASGGYVVDEIAKAQFYKAEGADLIPDKCQGKNCQAGRANPSIEHSLQCQEEAIYTFSGKSRPGMLDCEKLIEDRWKELGNDPRFNKAAE